jgi:hypothetical protein
MMHIVDMMQWWESMDPTPASQKCDHETWTIHYGRLATTLADEAIKAQMAHHRRTGTAEFPFNELKLSDIFTH